MLISKNSNTRPLDQNSLLNSIIIPRYGFYFRSTDFADKAFIHRIQVQCANKLKKQLFCDKALLSLFTNYLDDYTINVELQQTYIYNDYYIGQRFHNMFSISREMKLSV